MRVTCNYIYVKLIILYGYFVFNFTLYNININ